MMKNFLLILAIALMALSLSAGTIHLTDERAATTLEQNSQDHNVISYSVPELSYFDIKTKNGDFTQFRIENFAYTNRIGEPQLPMQRKIIAVPYGADVEVTILDQKTTEVLLPTFGINNDIFPAQPSLSKSMNPDNVEFMQNNEVYATDSYNNHPTVSATELGYMRGVRLYMIDFEPVRYNPIEKTLEITTSITVDISFDGADYRLTRERREATFSPAFEAVYGNTVFNYTPERDVVTEYPVKYLIVSHRMFEAQLQPFIAWKKLKGFEVIVAYTDQPEVGTTTTAIRNYILGVYNAATPESPAPSYLLLVGDTAQIPAFSGATGGHITDLNYVKCEGTDYIPEIYFSRFSAQNTNQLQPQIDKTLEYEQYLMPDPSYLAEVVMIAGMDSGHGANYGNGQINYGTNLYFNTAHGITSHTYLYPASGSSAQSIISNVSSGVSYANYTAHGSETSWSDPSFTVNNVNNLQNQSKYCLAVGNCCLTNSFQVDTCFGEAWLRAANKGGIGYIGGTNSTYWDEDYWWGVGSGPIIGAGPTYAQTGLGAYDGIFHDHNEPFADWATTTGAINYCGLMAVVEGNGNMNYYWEIYAIMGDASLSPFIGVPTENEVSYQSTIMLGMTSLDVTAAPYSYIALSFEGETYAVALADENGQATLNFESFPQPGMADIVITCQNKIPVIEQVEVIPAEGPYVVVDTYEAVDANNGIIEYGESFSLNIAFENVGVETANGLIVTISSADPYVTITDNECTFDNINAAEVISIDNAFAITLAQYVPDQHQIDFNINITGTNGNWSTDISLGVNSPVLSIGEVIVDDSQGNNNGIFNAGETVVLSFPVSNIGHAISPEAIVNFASTNPYLTITSSSIEIGQVVTEEASEVQFTATISADAPDGEIIMFGLGVYADNYSALRSFAKPLVLFMDNYETGDLTEGWQAVQTPWIVTDDEAYEGDYSMVSSNINSGQSSGIQITLEIPFSGILSFYKKVSSESGYDYLKFYIDNQVMDSWAGEVAWSEETYTINAGNHTFKWEYSKDGSVDEGSDCAWVDMVVFPTVAEVEAPMFALSTNEIDMGEVIVNTVNTTDFLIINYGTDTLTGTLSDTDVFDITIENAVVRGKGKSRDVLEYSIPPQSYARVIVNFTPTAVGEYSDILTITSNDPQLTQTTFDISAVVVQQQDANDDNNPAVTALIGNYPNPFNPTTSIKFSLANDSRVSIEIYNLKGQKVKTLVNDNFTTGTHSVTWNGDDNQGSKVTSGIYFYQLNSGGKYTSTKKMLLLK